MRSRDAGRVAAGPRPPSPNAAWIGVEHLRAGPERVLVAREHDDARLDRVERRLERGPDAVLAAARADEGRQRAGGADAGGPDESASCQAMTPPACARRARSCRLQHAAEHLRRLLHLVHRARSRSARGSSRTAGSRGRPSTPCLAQASRKSFAGRPTSTKRKLPCEAAGLQPRSSQRLDGERAHRGVALALGLDVLRVVERRDRGGDAEHADVVRHLQLRELLDRVGLADRVADAHAGHAVRLRERARDEHVRASSSASGTARLVRRVGHVLVIRLVDQDDGVGRRLADALDEVGHGLRAVHRRGRIVRVVEEDEARPPSTARDHRLDVEPERRVDLDLGDGML